MTDLIESSALWLGVTEDPRIVYSLAAAALLAAVSLVTGLGRRDFLPLLRPGALLRLCGALVAAFGLVLLAELAPVAAQEPLAGLARFPLLLIALAYGPSAGLLSGLLFAAVTAGAPLPGWHEAIFTLELLILGWLALYPSPRAVRWAGPLNALLAHALATGTAGVALLAWQGEAVSLRALLQLQGAQLPGMVAAWLLLAAVGPRLYLRYLPNSRIEPGASPAPRRQGRGQGAFLYPQLHRPMRPKRSLAQPDLRPDDPNG